MYFARSSCRFLFTPLTCLALILTASLLRAQVAGGRIHGTVIDSSGAAVPQAKVTIKNVDTGVTVSLLTANDGIYQAPNLLPGRYEVTAVTEGFDTLILKDIVLTVGGEVVINPQLKVGSVSTKVEVSGQASSVETSSSALNAMVTASTMRELPLNGRDWTSLATLQPGIANVLTQAANAGSGARGNRAFGNELTVAGHRPENNNYRIDGISINDYSNSGPGSAAGLNLGVDSIAEFSVLTSNYSAEYGRTSGGVINAITRSGNNAFHGGGYEFLRNSALDARNFFDGSSVPPFKRNQFGASAGGPIRKDKTFIFGSYEGIRQNQSVTTVATVPSLAARGGTLHNSDGSIRSVPVDSALAPYFSFWPLPNGPLLGFGDTGVFRFAAPQITGEDFWTVRGDHLFSERDKLFVTYMFDNGTLQLPDSLDNFLVGNVTNRRMAALEETHVFSQSFLNSVRFGYSRSKGLVTHDLGAINPKAADVSLGTIPGRPTAVISVPGLTSLAGAGSMTDFKHIQNSFQLYDDAFANRGRHSLKLGFAFERLQYDPSVLRQPNGTFSFGSLAALLTNNPTSLFAPDLTRSNPVNMRQSLVAGYFQDDWLVRQNLTLNLGLRYEISTRPTETSGQLMAVRDPFSGAPQKVDSYFASNPTLRNFEPRVGFAWDPRGGGKTAIRGGFGIYDALPLLFSYTAQAAQSAPFNVSTVQQLPPNIGAFPKKAYSLVVFNLATSMGVFVEPNPKRNYLMNWNFTVQRRIASDLTATAAYVGSRGVHNGFGVSDTNVVAPTLTPQGFLWPATGNRANPNVGALAAFLWNGSSSYHGLQTQISKSLSRGFQLQGSYTWSKCLDTESATARTFQFTNGLVSWPLAIPNGFRRGPCDFNLSHVFVFNTVWTLPSPQWGRAASALLGGWELGSILNASTGAPFSVFMGGDPLGMKNTNPIDFPMRLNAPGCDHPVNPGNVFHYIKTECFAAPNPLKLFGNAGRNILVGPSLVNLDFSLYKNIPVRLVSEAFRVQFRTEFFNILNHTNFAPPLSNNTVFNQSGVRVDSAGLINATQTNSRQIQFGVKVQW